jgi:HSP20 family protein
MGEVGAKRQRSEETNLTPSERTEGLARKSSQGIERGRRGYYPSIFSVSPGEFFTMSPITLMRRFTEDIDRAFSGVGGHLGRQGDMGQDFSWVPTVEVRQEGNNLIVRTDLPGLSENDVKLEATDEALVIQGERKREHSSEEGGWHVSERTYGRFYRLIPLPENAKIDEAQANFRNGVLEVSIPVPESEKKHRQIPIGTAQQGRQEAQQANTGQAKAAAAGR